MFEEIVISYRMKITEVIQDGFRGYVPKARTLFKNAIIRDNVVLADSYYKSNQEVLIKLKLMQNKKEDLVKIGIKRFYVAVYQTTNNGFYTKSIEDQNKFKSMFFYEGRGMVTSPALESNPFEVGDIIEVTITDGSSEA